MIRMLLFLCSALLFLAGGWIRIRTWGSRLLYVHSVLGRYYRIYLVLWALALACLAAGMYFSRKQKKKEEKEELKTEDKTEEKTEGKTNEGQIIQASVRKAAEETAAETKEETVCPNCGTRLKPGAVFCKNCGCRINEEKAEQKDNM